MTRYQYFILLVALTATLVAGCKDGATSSNSALNVNLASSIEDPCATVLLPLPDSDTPQDDATDRLIARYQQAAASATRPLLQFERLGWGFVAKARRSRDVGYFNRAEQVAACMDLTHPATPEAMLLRGHALHNLHRFTEAEAVARHLVAQRGLWFDFALLGDVLLERGALDDAVDAYQQVIDQRPGPQAQMRVAQLRWLKGDLQGALAMYANAVRTTSARTPEAAAWAHVRLASVLLQIDEAPAAERALERALALQNAYAPALHLKGRIRLSQGRLLEAIDLLERAVAADPMPEFRWTLYEALDAAGQEGAAERHKAELVRWGEAEDPRTFALFLATQGEDPATALRLALQELQQREDVFTLDAVAWASSAAGMPEQALAYSRRALAAGTQDARLFLHAGVIAARAGEHSRAIALLHQADTLRATLLPSEQRYLATDFAALRSQTPALVVEVTRREDEPIF